MIDFTIPKSVRKRIYEEDAKMYKISVNLGLVRLGGLAALVTASEINLASTPHSDEDDSIRQDESIISTEYDPIRQVTHPPAHGIWGYLLSPYGLGLWSLLLVMQGVRVLENKAEYWRCIDGEGPREKGIDIA